MSGSKQRPIMFSAPMILALQDGRKTETRRLLTSRALNPEPGDSLWVRETWRTAELETGLDGIQYHADLAFLPIANAKRAADAWLTARGNVRPDAWRPSIYMPRWASRITLDVVSVEEQRLHDITTNDIIAEGVDVPDVDYTVPDDPRTLDHERDCYAREKFRELWDLINGKRMPWVQNPPVRVIRFEVELTTILREP